MRRWLALAAALYPRTWRAQYGEEFRALLDDVKPGWRTFANILAGAITMHLTTETNWLKLSFATSALGAILALGASFTVAPFYESSAVLSVTPQIDPLRPASPQALHQRAAARVADMETEILSRTSLAETVRKLDLYAADRRRLPLEDVLQQMRRNTRIQTLPSTGTGLTPVVFSISFLYPDRVSANAAVRELADKFTLSNTVINRRRASVYRYFWQDQAAFTHAPPAPAPPVGEIVKILDPPSIPDKPLHSHRLVFLGCGLLAGLLTGLLSALAMRRPRGIWQLGGFAAAGCLLAAAASFPIPGRYTSTAVMMIEPAALTEDPLASAPPVTPAADLLRQIEPDVLSVRKLKNIIEDPGLNLYPGERARLPIEEVAKNMVARDLHIAVLNPVSEADTAITAFSVSFSYSDKDKARAVVQKLLTAIFDERMAQQQAAASHMTAAAREILSRKAGENLDVLDPPSLPVAPQTPTRFRLVLAGTLIGLLAGAILLGLMPPIRSLPMPVH